jgi:hypothetical protein
MVALNLFGGVLCELSEVPRVLWESRITPSLLGAY